MNAFAVISICFGILIIWVLTYEPRMIIENEDGSVTFEHIPGEQTKTPDRVHATISFVFMWAVAQVIVYHQIVWSFLQVFFHFKF